MLVAQQTHYQCIVGFKIFKSAIHFLCLMSTWTQPETSFSYCPSHIPHAASSSSPHAASDLEQARPQTSGEEELQLQLALAMSREESQKVKHTHTMIICDLTHSLLSAPHTHIFFVHKPHTFHCLFMISVNNILLQTLWMFARLHLASSSFPCYHRDGLSLSQKKHKQVHTVRSLNNSSQRLLTE